VTKLSKVILTRNDPDKIVHFIITKLKVYSVYNRNKWWYFLIKSVHLIIRKVSVYFLPSPAPSSEHVYRSCSCMYVSLCAWASQFL